RYPFIHCLEDHLKLAGLKVQIHIEENQKAFDDPLRAVNGQHTDYILYIDPECYTLHNNIKINQNPDGSKAQVICILPDQFEDLNDLKDFDFIDFSKTGNYYFSFFTLLKTLNVQNSIENSIEEFTRSYNEIHAHSNTYTHKIDGFGQKVECKEENLKP